MLVKKPDPARIFSYCHKNNASNYDDTSVVKKIEELIVNGVIDQNYKINNPETESDKNQLQGDARESDQTSSNISKLSIPIQHDTLPDITPTSPTLISTDHQQNKPNDSENPDFSTTIMQPSQLLTPTAENEAYHNYTYIQCQIDLLRERIEESFKENVDFKNDINKRLQLKSMRDRDDVNILYEQITLLERENSCFKNEIKNQ